ncbi:unnamed protein product [Gongylonema pulchrum]|uniref:Cyclophil_like2 domain-containing protein n=1 Tax=Gongylonema pulchrum TaxID=637853 RepID=A0A183DNX0_9BILA|nr:unnamed protein product [Gongylonema pulchrum]
MANGVLSRGQPPLLRNTVPVRMAKIADWNTKEIPAVSAGVTMDKIQLVINDKLLLEQLFQYTDITSPILEGYMPKANTVAGECTLDKT